MLSLTSGTPLRELAFKLVPDSLTLAVSKLRDPEAAKFDKLYRMCHFAVFDEFPKQGTRIEAKIARTCEDNARELGCGLRLYVLSAMVAHRESCPERVYQPVLLVGQGVNARVASHRKACSSQFATFDEVSFAALYTLSKKFERSELKFSEYLVGSGSTGIGSIPAFYRDNELTLDPYWCATEKSYVDMVLKPFIDGKLGGTAHKSRLRHASALALSSLKRSQHDAVAAFKVREEAVKVALVEILRRRRELTELKYSSSVVTDAAKFWTELGTFCGPV